MLRSATVAIGLAGLASLVAIQLAAPKSSGPEPEVSGYVPLPPETEFSIAIELEKTRFLQGEQIVVFLVTELGSGERRPIPDRLLHQQRIIFTRPDGTTRVDRKPMSIDTWEQPGAYGSRYEHRLTAETPQAGRWSVVFEMGPYRSPSAEFAVGARKP